MVDIDDFKVEVSCEYKGKTYSVRDNGAIMRHPKNQSRVRPLDNRWTFGIKNEENGYMFFASNIRVHQVVATAFWGHLKADGMVVDHKDTNRCNNRAENLQWVSKLENVLNNPITRRRVINICGSIEAFLANPSLLRNSTSNPNFTWMRTVSEEEAAKCKANLERWSREDADFVSGSQGEGIGEWIFKEFRSDRQDNDKLPSMTQIPEPEHPISQAIERKKEFVPILEESLTVNAMQEDWSTPTEFPLCPPHVVSLEDYYVSLEKGKVFSKNTYGATTVIGAALSDDKEELCVVSYNPNAFKQWYIAYVYIFDNKYVHRSGGSFFSEVGALKTITLFQGKEWTGGNCVDDYC